jgi:hypothetical protein
MPLADLIGFGDKDCFMGNGELRVAERSWYFLIRRDAICSFDRNSGQRGKVDGSSVIWKR